MPGRICGGCGGSGGLQEDWLVTLSLWREGAMPVSTAFGRQLWELLLGVMERSRTGLLKGSVWCGVLHPKALCGLFQASLVRPERNLFSDTNISRTKPKEQQWGGTGVNWELPSTSQPRAVPWAQGLGCSSSLDVPVLS